MNPTADKLLIVFVLVAVGISILTVFLAANDYSELWAGRSYTVTTGHPIPQSNFQSVFVDPVVSVGRWIQDVWSEAWEAITAE